MPPKKRKVNSFQPSSFTDGIKDYPLSVKELQAIYFPPTPALTGMPLSDTTSLSFTSVPTTAASTNSLSSAASTSCRTTGTYVSRLFPLPDVRKGDELDLDPEYPPQSFQEYRDDENRVLINPAIQKIYIIGIGWESTTTTTLSNSTINTTSSNRRKKENYLSPPFSPFSPDSPISYAHLPPLEAIAEYVKIFYHGITVELLPLSLHFVPWTTAATTTTSKASKRVNNRTTKTSNGKSSSSSTSPSLRYIGATDGCTGITRIRCRRSMDNLSMYQINLNDTLDCVQDILVSSTPSLSSSTIAVMGITPYDLYEMDIDDEDYDSQDEDLFTCGRAYGGSKIAIISAARYNPFYDDHPKKKKSKDDIVPKKENSSSSSSSTLSIYTNGIRVDQTWPLGSNAPLSIEGSVRNKFESLLHTKKKDTAETLSSLADCPSSSSLSSSLFVSGTRYTFYHFQQLWYARLCKTAVHELGHCLILDHCCYYSCTMQGSAHLKEDMRQPPYLCPVCLSKIVYGIYYEHRYNHGSVKDRSTPGNGTASKDKISFLTSHIQERYKALYRFCTHYPLAINNPMFEGYGLWLQLRLQEMNVSVDGE